MDILVGGFVLGIFVAPIVVIWLWVRMVRRDGERARRIEQGDAQAAAPRGYLERRMQDKGRL